MKNYQGSFNYQGEVWRGHTTANSLEQAFYKLLEGMAKAFNTSSHRLRNYFLASPVRWEIKQLKSE